MNTKSAAYLPADEISAQQETLTNKRSAKRHREGKQKKFSTVMKRFRRAMGELRIDEMCTLTESLPFEAPKGMIFAKPAVLLSDLIACGADKFLRETPRVSNPA